MKVLGIDSTADIGCAALCENGKIIAEFSLRSGYTHSVTLLPMTDSVLSAAGLDANDIELFCTAAGPGSFTGVRISASTLKGLAFADDTPCVGVSSLAAMAEPYKSLRGIICPVINARRESVFTALFRVDGIAPPERLTEDAALSVYDVAAALEKFKGESIYLTGDAAEDIAKLFCKDGSDGGATADTAFVNSPYHAAPMILSPRAGAGAALLGERIYLSSSDEERKKFTSDALSPIYLKKPQAEREREERLKGADKQK